MKNTVFVFITSVLSIGIIGASAMCGEIQSSTDILQKEKELTAIKNNIDTLFKKSYTVSYDSIIPALKITGSDFSTPVYRDIFICGPSEELLLSLQKISQTKSHPASKSAKALLVLLKKIGDPYDEIELFELAESSSNANLLRLCLWSRVASVHTNANRLLLEVCESSDVPFLLKRFIEKPVPGAGGIDVQIERRELYESYCRLLSKLTETDLCVGTTKYTLDEVMEIYRRVLEWCYQNQGEQRTESQ